MLAVDEDALICDLAETYGVFDYEALPPVLAATLSCGLREDSRIKRKLSGRRVGEDTLLLASAADSLRWLVWAKTEDGRKNRNRPEPFLRGLVGGGEETQVQSFDTIEEFEAARRSILEGSDQDVD